MQKGVKRTSGDRNQRRQGLKHKNKNLFVRILDGGRTDM
jgi:hypothetical protein